MMIYIQVGVRFQRKSEDRCSMNLRNIMCGLPSMRKKFKLTSIIKPESCLQEYFVNVGDTMEFQHLWFQISGPSYRNFGIVMKSLKRGVTLGKWLAHRTKGGSLYTGGAISQLTRKKRMEKELGRPVPQEELFKATHTKKTTDPTKGEKWIETRAQETYERFMQKVQEYRSTLPMEGQEAPLSQEITERLWRESAGEPVRGVVYGYTEKAYHEKKAWFYCASSSNVDGVDKEKVSKMEDKISLLTAELVVVAERERKRDEQIAADSQRYAELRAQLNSLFDSGKIIPPGRAFVDESEEEDDEA